MRFMALIALLCLVMSAAKAEDKSIKEEHWEGTMDVGSRVFRFRIEPVAGADGSTGRQLVSLDEGKQVFRLDDFHEDDKRLTFNLKISKATYAGEMADDGRTSTGKWSQGGKDFDLVFRKAQAAAVDQPTEIWSGTLSVLFQKLTLQFRSYRQADGTDVVYMDSVSQRAGGFKAMRKVDGDQWSIEIPAIGGTFKGTSDNKSEVKGKWTQGGVSFDLILTRQELGLEDAVKAPNRPQTPQAPFPYLIEDVSFRNEVDDVQLAGTLTIPRTEEPTPAVVMITGSGPQDRDETLLDHKPFWVIADHLSRHGIAVLRFDDRGTGASQGDFSTATSEQFANDVEAAIEQLKKDSRISSKSIGLIGHSEGGLIASIVAARRSDIAFAVLLAGPGVNGKEILVSQGRLILQAEGIDDENALKMQRETQLAMFDSILHAAPNASVESLVDNALKRLENVLPEESRNDKLLKAKVEAGIERLNSPWFRFFLTFEPATQIQRIQCPVLAINGEKDVQVDPHINLPAIQAALEKGKNAHFKVIEFPELNHLFQTCTTGGLSEYQSIEETFAPIVLQTITDWIKESSIASEF